MVIAVPDLIIVYDDEEDTSSDQSEIPPSKTQDTKTPYKIGFLFLLYEDLHQETLWEEYFRNAKDQN